MKQVNLKNHEIQINTLEFFVINFSRILVPTTLLSLFFPRTYDKTKNTPIVIFGESIIPGESKTINVEIARLHTTTKLNIPVIVRRSKIDGPVVLFQQEFMEMKLMESKYSAIDQQENKPTKNYYIPIINVYGFVNKSREFPDGRDLNRVFPGSKTGSLASRFAFHILSEIMPIVNYAVDFHAGASRFNAHK
jgi:hypothetical protein